MKFLDSNCFHEGETTTGLPSCPKAKALPCLIDIEPKVRTSRTGSESVNLSHQYIDQLPLPVRQAVFGNVGTLIAFRIGYTDAEVIEKELGKTFTASALVDLDRYEAAVKVLECGTNKEPFRAKMLPPMENHIGRTEKLIAQSRERFASPRASVEDKMNRWIGSIKTEHRGR